MWQLRRVSWALCTNYFCACFPSMSLLGLSFYFLFVCLVVCLVVCLESRTAAHARSTLWRQWVFQARGLRSEGDMHAKRQQQSPWWIFTGLCSCSASYSKIRLEMGWSTFLYNLMVSVSSLFVRRAPLEFQIWENSAILWPWKVLFFSFTAGMSGRI